MIEIWEFACPVILIDEVDSLVTKLVDMDALAAVSGGSVSRNIWKAC
jgi:hypothetical protein